MTVKTKTEAPFTSEVCAYCRLWEPDTGPKCRYNRGTHRFEPIDMDPQVLSILLDGSVDPEEEIHPNFWHGFDIETVRLSTDDGQISLLVFDERGVTHGVLNYRVDFSDGTPISLIRAAFAEARLGEQPESGLLR